MSVNIYDELDTLRVLQAASSLELAALAARVGKLEAAGAPPQPRVGVVSYFRTTALWDALIASKPAVSLINPGSGPGPSPDSLYVALVPRLKAAAIPVYGYVHTKYGTRPIAEVKADITNHKMWYGIDGIFVDTVSTQPALLPYYRDLCSFIRSNGLKVVLNPGSSGPEELAQIADYVVVAENYWRVYRDQPRPTWEMKYPGKLWHMVHECPAAEMRTAVELMKVRGAGLVYVTDDIMPNPWNTLPTYWSALVAAVEAL